MKEKTLTIDNIAKITNLNSNTIRTYLGNYRFVKFLIMKKEGTRLKKVYKFNSDFVTELSTFLYLKRRWGSIKLLGDYCGKNFFIRLENEEN